MLSCYHVMSCCHVTKLSCYHVIMLPCYHFIMLSCYRVISLHCNHVIMLSYYHVTMLLRSHITMTSCRNLTMSYTATHKKSARKNLPRTRGVMEEASLLRSEQLISALEKKNPTWQFSDLLALPHLVVLVFFC